MWWNKSDRRPVTVFYTECVVSLNTEQWQLVKNESESNVTYGQVRWPIGICALQLIHSKSTHTVVNTHPEQGAAISSAAPGEQLGVRCLAQGHLVVVLRVERALYIHSSHLQFLPAWDSNSLPLDYVSDSLPLGHDFQILALFQNLVICLTAFMGNFPLNQHPKHHGISNYS